MKFEHIKDCGDATAIYRIILEQPTTVKDFVQMVVEHSSSASEWGDIWIQQNPNGFDYVAKVIYDRGRIVEVDGAMPNDTVIREVKANGGWSVMSYYVVI